MSNLKQYLSDRPKGEFAKQIGVSPSQLSQYLSGHRRPSYKRMLEIEGITGGEVTVQSWTELEGLEPEAKIQGQGAA